MRISLTTILTFFLCITFISCEDDDSNNAVLQNTATNLTITDGVGNESTVFNQGESIKFPMRETRFRLEPIV